MDLCLFYGCYLFLLVVIPGAETCHKFPDREYSMENMFDLAPTLIYGTSVFLDVGENQALVEVTCVYKAEADLPDLPRNFDVLGVVTPHSCHHPVPLTIGTPYIFALQLVKNPYNDTGRYVIYEPDVMQRAIFPATKENLEAAASGCGVEIRAMPTKTCPTEVIQQRPRCVQAEIRAASGKGHRSTEDVLLWGISFIFYVLTYYR